MESNLQGVCARWAARLSEIVSLEELTTEERAEFQDHVLHCARCEGLRFELELMSMLRSEMPDGERDSKPALPPRVLEMWEAEDAHARQAALARESAPTREAMPRATGSPASHWSGERTAWLRHIERSAEDARARQQREDDLVQRTQDGDGRAFDALVEDYREDLYRFVYHRLHGDAEAETLVWMTFAQAWKGLPTYHRLGKPFSAYLFTIAERLIITRYRRKAREGSKTCSLEQMDASVREGSPPPEYPYLAPFDERLIVQLDSRDDLTRALEQLSAQKRKCLLYSFHGYTYYEIARMLSITPGTVGWYISQAKHSLRLSMRDVAS